MRDHAAHDDALRALWRREQDRPAGQVTVGEEPALDVARAGVGVEVDRLGGAAVAAADASTATVAIKTPSLIMAVSTHPVTVELFPNRLSNPKAVPFETAGKVRRCGSIRRCL